MLVIAYNSHLTKELIVSIKDQIAEQEARKKKLKSIGSGLIKTAPKAKISTKQRIELAERAQLKAILQALHDGKRNIPKEWERGYHAAMSAVESAAANK